MSPDGSTATTHAGVKVMETELEQAIASGGQSQEIPRVEGLSEIPLDYSRSIQTVGRSAGLPRALGPSIDNCNRSKGMEGKLLIKMTFKRQFFF